MCLLFKHLFVVLHIQIKQPIKIEVMKAFNYFSVKIGAKSIEFTLTYDCFDFAVTTEDGAILMDGYFTPYKSDEHISVSSYTRSVELFADVLESAVRKSIKSNKEVYKSIIKFQLNKKR